MEPQIIDHYNELPNGINVIDKMNIEFDELQQKYDNLEKKYSNLKKKHKKLCKFLKEVKSVMDTGKVVRIYSQKVEVFREN